MIRIEVDQSALTGESLPVECKSGDAVFSGSIVRKGEIDGLVYGTGMDTYFGNTAQLVQEAHTVSHFQRAVLKIGNYLIILAAALVALIVIVTILRGDPILGTLAFALVLCGRDSRGDAYRVIGDHGGRCQITRKEGSHRNATISIEELAGMDVLCSDRRAITQNK